MNARKRPRLSVSILTKNAAGRLPRLLAEARAYADEIVVGVDASSTDGTLAAAAAGADVVYRFALEKAGQLAPARLLPFDYATGGWILTLDDDESMEDTFDAVRDQLLRDPTATHYYFPRKWIVSEDPPEYVHAPPWYPNWAPRLIRNDRSLVWKPPQPHTMYQVQGPGYYDARTSILHFEPVWCPPERRREKLAAYRVAGAAPASEEHYAVPEDAPRRPVRLRAAAARWRRAAARVHDGVRTPALRALPPWSALFVDVDVPAGVDAGAPFIARVTVRNTGGLAWTQQYAQYPANPWPMLRLGYRFIDDAGAAVDEPGLPRIVLPRFTAPGDDVVFVDRLTAPERRGTYTLEWDMVSEGHCWFSECGSAVSVRRLSVR